MKYIFKKCFALVIVIMLMQQLIPFSAKADTTSESTVTIRQTVKESIESYDKINDSTDSIFMSGSTPSISFNNKDYQVFEVTFEESGYYSLDIYYGAPSLSYKPITAFLVHDGTDYVEIARANIEPTGAYSTFAYQTVGHYAFMEGTYKIKVYQPYADIFFSAISLTKKADGLNVRQSIESYNKATGGTDTVATSGSKPFISFNGGDYQVFEYAVAKDGLYKFDLCLGAVNPEYRAITAIYIYDGTDYVEAGRKIVDSTGAYTNFEEQTVGYYELSAGINKIKVYQRYADIYFSGITLTKMSDEIDKITKPASDFVTATATVNDDSIMKMSHASWATYSIDVSASGRYMLFVTASNVQSTNMLSAFINDTELCAKKFDKGINNIFTEYYIGNLNLTQGTNELKIKHTGTMYVTFSISSLALVRIGDACSSVIAGNSRLLREAAYDASTKDEILYEGDYLSYDVNIEEAGIYKVSADAVMESGSFGVSIDGKNVGKISDAENGVFFFEAEVKNVNLKIQILSGSANISALNFNKTAAEEKDLDAFVSEINSAETVIETEKAVTAWKEVFIPDFDSLTSELISLAPVYAEMCSEKYDSVNEAVTHFNALVAKEKINPTIVLLKDGEETTAITNGNLSVKVYTKHLGQNMTIVGAVYENKKLCSVGAGNYTGAEAYLEIPIGNLEMSAENDYSLKVMYINSLETVKPAENFDKVYKEFFVSANGADTNPGTESQPFASIEQALDAVVNYTSEMTGDIVINVSDGNYEISQAINITTAHSGLNGYNVIIRGCEENKPVINGGVKIENWNHFENGIYRAPYDTDKDVRNLYVNGFPAVRAKSEYAFRCVEFYSADGETNSGLTVRDSYFPTSFTRPQDLELVWEIVWEAQRTPVADVAYDGQTAVISIKPELFTRNNSSSTTGFGPNKLFYLENAYELLDQPGEFYYNPTEGYIYYYPTENETLSEAEIYVGCSQGLVTIEGNGLSDKVSNVVFENISFKYGSWENVSEYGFIGRQADCVNDTTKDSGYYILPAQFTVNYADGISVRDCEFSCLGSSALAYRNGVTNSEVIGNKITDVSGTAIAIGSFEHENDLTLSCENIQIKNNLIRRAAIEYRCCAGIALYYDAGVEICHNTLMDLPYTAITGGWGWGATETGRAGSNRVCHNYIENVVTTLSDGGGIYFLGTQKNTVITENYINQVNRKNASLYSDNGSAFLHFYKNVCTNSTRFATASPGGHTNYYVENYTDTDYIYEEYEKEYGLNKDNFLIIKDNVIIDPENLPDEALAIKDASGVESGYVCLVNDTEIPTGKNSVIDITPKRTYTNGVIYEGENYKAISDAGAGVVVYSNCIGISSPQWAEFEIEADKAGVYDFSVYSSIGNTTGAVIKVLVNGEVQNSGSVVSTGDWSIYTNNEIGEITLPEGTVTLRISCTSGSFQLDCFTLEYLREN